MKRDQFTFYRSYYEAMKQFPAKNRDKLAGELFLAVCAYALDGEEPKLSGLPLALFTLIRPTLESGMRQAQKRKQEVALIESVNGSKCNSVPITEQNKHAQKCVSDSVTDRNEKEGEKEREYECEREYEYEKEEKPPKPPDTSRRFATPTDGACARDGDCGGVIAFDGSDLTQDIENRAEAERLIKRYGLPDRETTFCALLDDFAKHGQEKVRKALEEAALSDKQGGISVNYYRAVLANLGKPRAAPARAQPTAAQGTTNPFLRIAMQMREGGST